MIHNSDLDVTPQKDGSFISAFINWVSRQSLARLFSYPRFLEREIERLRADREIERTQHKEERERWESERKSLQDRLLEINRIPQINNTMPSAPTVEAKPYSELPRRQRLIEEAKAKEIAMIRNGHQ